MAGEASRRLSDEELLHRHAGGDASGFAELVDRYTPELYRFLMRFLGRRNLVDDVLQETFLQVHVSSGSFDVTRRVKPWLFTIAANKARDLLRSRARKREVSIDQPAGDEDAGMTGVDLLAGPADSPEHELSKSERSRRVRAVVKDLPDHLREVLILGYFHRLQYRDIAEILGIPIGTVKSRLHSAVAEFGAAYRRRTAADRSTG